MSTMTSEQIEKLLQPMLKMRLYAAISKTVRSADEVFPFVPEHLEYMLELEKNRVLFASGPFVQPGVLVGSGLTILRAQDLSQAKGYLDEEPLIKRGLRTYEIWQWELREGYLNTGIRLGTGQYTFE